MPWQSPKQEEAAATLSSGLLVSGRYSTQQGTMNYQWEYEVHKDGKVSEILTIESTYKFADYWRDRYDRILASGNTEYALSKEDISEKMVVRAKKAYDSLDALNEAGAVQFRLISGPLFRSLSFKAETPAYTSENMVNTYGPHEQATAEDWVNFLKGAIGVSFVVRDEATGQTHRWSKTAGEIGDGISVLIESKQWRPLAYWGGGAVALFLGFVIYMGTLGRRHWDDRDRESEG